MAPWFKGVKTFSKVHPSKVNKLRLTFFKVTSPVLRFLLLRYNPGIKVKIINSFKVFKFI